VKKMIIVALFCLFPVFGWAQTVPTQIEMIDGLDEADPRLGRMEYVEIFGQNLDVDTGTDPEDAWFDSVYVWLDASGAILRASSSVSTDTATIKVTGLSTAGNIVSENFSVTGVTPDTGAVTFWRVNSVENTSSTATTGNIAIYEATADTTTGIPNNSSNIKGYIAAGQEKSHHGFYTVPVDYDAAYIDFIEIQSASTTAECEIWVRPSGGIWKNILSVDTAAGAVTTSGRFYKLDGNTDVLVKIKEVGGDNAQVNVRVGLWLYVK